MQTKPQQFLENAQYAAVLAFVLSLLGVFFSLATLLAIVVVGVVTLKHGIKRGALTMAWALLPIVSTLFVGYDSLFDLSWLSLVGVWALAAVLYKGGSWLRVLEWLWGLAVIAVLAMHLFMPDLNSFWLHVLPLYFRLDITAQMLSEHMPTTITAQQLATQMAPFGCGLVLSNIVFDIAVSLLITRLAYIFIYRQQPENLAFTGLRIPMIYSLVWLVLLAIGLSTRQGIALDLLPVAFPMFLLSGLSLVNAYLSRRQKPMNMLMFGVVIVALIWQPLLAMCCVIVLLMGLLDSFVNFRHLWLRSKVAPVSKN